MKFGEGTKNIVIIPGLSVGNVTTFAGALYKKYRNFSREYTVYFFDRLEDVNTGYSIKDIAFDTVTACEKVGIKSASFIGMSQGGMACLYIGVYFPNLVEKLVLCSTAPVIDENFDRIRTKWSNYAKTGQRALLAESFAKYIYSDTTYIKNIDLMIAFSENYTDKELDNFAIMAMADDVDNIIQKLEIIKCPTLVIGAEGDKVFDCAYSKMIAEKTKGELFIYGKEYGHTVYDEAPDYVERLYNFIK